MKKIIFKFIISLFAIFCIVSLYSCNKQEKVYMSTELRTTEYIDFLADVDSLNMSYGCSTASTKGFFGWAVGSGVESFADKLGSKAGAWIGKRIGASLGIIIANPVVAVGGYLIGDTVGGVVGYAAASYAASLLFGAGTKPDVICDDSSTEYDVIDYENMTSGSLHNILIDRISNNGKNYVSENGEILVEEIYNDMLGIEKELGIQDPMSSDVQYKTEMVRYCNSILLETRISLRDNVETECYVQNLTNTLRDIEVPEVEINNFVELTAKLTLATTSLDEKQLQTYPKDFCKVVDESSLKNEEKLEAKAIGTVAISSTDYWKKE